MVKDWRKSVTYFSLSPCNQFSIRCASITDRLAHFLEEPEYFYNNLRSVTLFVFHSNWKRWITAIFLETTRCLLAVMMPNLDIHWNFWQPFSVSEIWRWHCSFFFKNIRALKMNVFENVDIDLHFRGRLLQDLDGRTYSAIVLMKTWWKSVEWCRR